MNQEQLDRLEQRLAANGIGRRDFLKLAAAVAATAAAGSALAGCTAPQQTVPAQPSTGSGAAASPAKEELAAEQVFVMIAEYEPTSMDRTLDPYQIGAENLFAGLTALTPDLRAEPLVAEKWEASSDGKTWTFHLRKDAKWNNGDPVTAKDFEFTFRRFMDPKTANPNTSLLYDIKNASKVNKGEVPVEQLGVRAKDDYTLEVECEGVTPYLPVLLGMQCGLPIHPPSVQKMGTKYGADAGFVTNGPFKLTSWEHDKQFVAERDDKYWGPKPKLQKVVYKIMPPTVGLIPYINNELDYSRVTNETMAQARNDPKLSKEMFPINPYELYYLQISQNIPPFDDLRVRQAIQHSIDRDKIIKSVLQDTASPAYTLVPPGIFGHIANQDEFKKYTNYDPKLAMELLKGTKYEGGKNWPKVLSSMIAQHSKDVAQACFAMIKESIGLEIELEVLERKVFTPKAKAKQVPIMFIGWMMDYPDANNFFRDLYWSPAGTRHDFKDDEYDKIVGDAAHELDDKKRLEMYRRADTILLEKAAHVPLYYPVNYRIIKPWAKGLPKNSAGTATPNMPMGYNSAFLNLYIVKH